MRIRAKLVLIVGTATFSLVLAVIGSALLGIQQTRRLDDVEDRLVPKLELEPRLEAEFERLGNTMQDAVAAQDAAALTEALMVKSRLFALIASAGPALEARVAAELRWAVQDYYDYARDISTRLIAGETGEALVDDIGSMQARRAKVVALIRRVAGLDRKELTAGFSAVRQANQDADRFRLVIGLGALALLVGLSAWGARGALRTLGSLSSGFARFGTGDFKGEVPVTSRDELGDVAIQANQMAASLRKLAEQRDRNDWVKAGVVGLSDELRGELEPEGLAHGALRFLVRYVGAQAGAFYASDDQGVLRLASHFAGSDAQSEASEDQPVANFRLGEGLLGQAALGQDLLVVDDVPPGYFKVRSGLGEATPDVLMIVPLARMGRTVGVLEFAFFGDRLSDATRELLNGIKESLAIALEAAKSRAALRELLEHTQRQALRLTKQEEELLRSNQELRVQQDELRRANEELEAQRAALSQQNSEIDDARKRVQQKAEELSRVSSYKSRFLANMSHELRTPLNSMLLLSHLLSANDAGNLTPKQVLHCKTIHSAGKDLLALINQVLDLARIESGRQEVHLEPVELSSFLAYARRVFEPLAAEKGLGLKTESLSGLPKTMMTDRSRVERILMNLLGNAIKFTDQGEVTLRIQRPGAELEPPTDSLQRDATIVFIVSDTGIGIPAHAHERVFAPFEQVESHPDQHDTGTGLGLAISRESALLLGGELTLWSNPVQGTTFACFLPERPLTHEEPRALPTSTGPLRRGVFDGRSPRPAELLLIEDDAVLVEQLMDIVRARQFDVLVANTGEEGIRLAREHRPCGIILDVVLPDIDGWAVMERLRQDPITEQIPVHFLSGVDTPERGLALGAVGYLTKPATHAELAEVVRALVATRSLPRILIVEDSEREGGAILELLSVENVEARWVRTAAQALHAIEVESFSFIILDLKLPDMDGLALLEVLKARTDGPAPRVVVHTGRALSRKEARQLEAHAEAVILKDGSSAQRLLEEVRLFVRLLNEPARASDEPRPSSSSHPQVSLESVKLLLAEDDMRTVYALSSLLGEKGAKVLVAENGLEALELLGQHPDVQAVLMDVMMPELDGYEAMRRLRRDSRFQALPVIALTAKAMKGERERCLEAGASDYLTKPIDSERLLVTLGTWLSKEGAHVTRRD